MKTKTSTKERIILAANTVAIEDGAAQLTLEAVAKRAEISKGGLLYHFPSKDALIEGMIAYALDGFNARFEQRLADGQDWLQAFLDATLIDNELDYQTSVSVMTAAALNPALLQTMRESFATWQQFIEDNSPDPVLGTIVRLAIDGLWFAHLVDFAPPDEAMTMQIHQRLSEMIKAQTQ